LQFAIEVALPAHRLPSSRASRHHQDSDEVLVAAQITEC